MIHSTGSRLSIGHLLPLCNSGECSAYDMQRSLTALIIIAFYNSISYSFAINVNLTKQYNYTMVSLQILTSLFRMKFKMHVPISLRMIIKMFCKT